MSTEPTIVYSAASIQQAYLLKSLLADEGIVARVVNDAIQIAGGDLPLGWTAAARVVVGRTDAERARKLAEEFDARTAHEPAANEADDTAAETPGWSPANDRAGAAAGCVDEIPWPTCPTCSERRMARCPTCFSSSLKFPLGTFDGPRSNAGLLLFCEACDDYFRPEWYRRCARCGHDFGDGIPTENAWISAPFTSRAEWLVAVLILAGSLAVTAYFYWLFGVRPG